MPYIKQVILLHMLSGAMVLLSGILVFILPKGRQTHKRIGWVFFGGMLLVSLSGFYMLTHRFNEFLFMIAILNLFLAYTGARVFTREQLSVNYLDWIISGAGLIAGFAGIIYGLYIYVAFGWRPVALLFVLFGWLLGASARDDINIFRGSPLSRPEQIKYHITRMGASFIAASTAFSLAGARPYIGDWPHYWLLWVLPTILLTPLLVYHTAPYKKAIKAQGNKKARN